MLPHLTELDLASIRELQGGSSFKLVQKLIAMAVADCNARPGEKKPRKVLLCLEISPTSRVEEVDEETRRTVADGLKLRLKHDIKFPVRETIEFDCGIGPNDTILFNPDSPHNHRQSPLPLTFDNHTVQFRNA